MPSGPGDNDMDSVLTPNENKNLRIETSFGAYDRGAIQTHFVEIGEDYVELVRRYVLPLYREGDILSNRGEDHLALPEEHHL